MTQQKTYSIGDAIYTKSEGLGTVTAISETTITAHMLETDTLVDLVKDMKLTIIVMQPDQDIAVPFDLMSEVPLRKELARLADVKDVKAKKRDRKKSLDVDTIVDRIMEKVRKGEKVDLSKL